jgi:hypothetical protein
MSILRSMDPFSYEEFRRQIEAKSFNAHQKNMLGQRLDLLDMCLKGGTSENSVSKHFRRGQLTIVEWDLSLSTEYTLSYGSAV